MSLNPPDLSSPNYRRHHELNRVPHSSFRRHQLATSMANGVTLDDAKAYFRQGPIEREENAPPVRVVNVEQVLGDEE